MVRHHGRAGRLYVGITGTNASAESVAFLNKWQITFETDDVDVTAFGDANKTYVSGLPDVGGTFSGFFDDATQQLYTAAQDGASRRFYLYPDATNNAGTYWWGTATFDFAAEGGVADAVSVSGNFKAASAVSRIG
jgi:hypothetical protein